MSESKEKVLSVTVKGIALFPKEENGKKSYAILLQDETAARLLNLVHKTFPQHSDYDLSYDDESGLRLLNVKSNYDVPAYYPDGTEFTDKIYHGADVYCKATIKEYTFKKRTGLTAYLAGFVVNMNGEPRGTDFKSIMNEVL